MTLSDYQYWLGVARRRSRRAAEAEDLLQDALLVAAEAGRLNFEQEEDRRWFAGVLRNRAAMTARSEGRRRRREQMEGEKKKMEEEQSTGPAGENLEVRSNADPLQGLPPAARRLAVLILHGMTRQEILFVLGLSPTAYRQRLVTVRKYLSERSQEFRVEMMATAYYHRSVRDETLERGLIRQALLASVRIRRDVGTHDPDGHLILLGSL